MSVSRNGRFYHTHHKNIKMCCIHGGLPNWHMTPNDVVLVSMRCHHVTSTSAQRHYDVICLLDIFSGLGRTWRDSVPGDTRDTILETHVERRNENWTININRKRVTFFKAGCRKQTKHWQKCSNILQYQLLQLSTNCTVCFRSGQLG